MTTKQTYLAMAVVAATAFSTPVLAANDGITDALKHRDNLSAFTDAMIATGVINELQPNRSYTIFAPTNAAFAKLNNNDFPCLANAQCKAEVADILRNHIVPGQVTFTGPVKGAVFSIDNMNLNLGTRNGEVRTVAGNNIVNRGQVLGGIVCEIDGVIATAQELANVTAIRYQPVKVEHNIIERTTVDKVYYAPDGTPDGMSKVTTFTAEPVAVEPR